MKLGYLSEYFEGVVAKRLSAVEADETRSNQHEYHATKKMQAFLGSPEEKTRIPARCLYLSDDDPDLIVEDAFLTLYNCRKGKPRAPEYHLYFPTTNVSLFTVSQQRIVFEKRTLLAAVDGIEVRYMGVLLNQTDLDVWEMLLHLAGLQPFGNKVEFMVHAFLKALWRGTSGKHHEELKEQITRLIGGVEITWTK